ncbi:putative inorganic phosphate cotransporter [Episyrphus balteatus]|uniref:putative inorganic phosphate cotransporter n=1 Tax=Episyrphus balteatus TaxID=286459 RepID=UPI002485D47A|nr:putative inorganic phosphate cotransporter [Episyrphus balteatus]
MNEIRRFDDKKKSIGLGIGIRHLQCFLIFFGQAVAHSLRVNLSVGIVAMTDKSGDSEYGIYSWDEQTRSVILSSFFFGYVITQVPSGQLAHKYGGHKVFFWGLFSCSLLAILTPICADFGGWQLVCALRYIQGICQGSLQPSSSNLLSKWSPVKELGLMGTISYSGSQLGTALMLCVSGEITASFMGWPGLFYVSGGMGCLWGLLFYVFGASSPSESQFISEEEKMYIETLSVPSAESPKDKNEESNRALPTPWLDIMTSVPFLCVVVVHCANNWAYNILLTQIPTYIKGVLQMDIKKNALFSSLPFWVMLALSYFFLIISEVLRKKQCMSMSVSRRFFNTIGNWIPAVGLICLGYLGKENETLVILLLMINVGMMAATYLGFCLNNIDLSPNFAGTLMGISNCIGHTTSIMAPLSVGFIVTDEKNPEQWRIVFFIAAAFLFIGNLLFIVFGKFEPQYWNEPMPVSVKTSRKNSQHSVYKETKHN